MGHPGLWFESLTTPGKSKDDGDTVIEAENHPCVFTPEYLFPEFELKESRKVIR